MIEVLSLTKRFSTARSYWTLLRFRRQETLTAVDNVSLQIPTGELFGLLGANGAGKTTLVKMLCTLILPSAGRALIQGKDVVTEAAAVRPLIGLVNAEERSFFWRLSGHQNLEFFAALYGLRGREAHRRIAAMLDLVGLSEQAGQPFMNYSSGMRQKLSIARGLLAAPPVIFMDEPTRSLDPVSAQELRRFVRETLVKEQGCTVVLVTHRLEEAEEICDRVAIMKRGRVVACGPVAAIKEQVTARHRYFLTIRNLSPAAVEGLQTVRGVLQVQGVNRNGQGLDLELALTDDRETLPEVIRYLVAQGGDIQYCQAQAVSLEEAFVQLVKDGAYDL